MIQFSRVKSCSSVVAITLVTWSISANAAALEKYVSAELVSDSQLKITLSDGRSRLMARHSAGTQFDEPQVGFEKPAVSPDGTRVGWLAVYPHSDANYPIPITLVIYKNGRIEARLYGDGQPTWNWSFDASGKVVAFCQRPSHGDFPSHYSRQRISRPSPDEEIEWKKGSDPVSALPSWAKSISC